MKRISGFRFFLHVPALMRDPLMHLCSLSSGTDEMVEFRVGDYVTYLLNDPDQIRSVLYDNIREFDRTHFLGELKPLLGNGLFTSDEVLWAGQRHLLAPAFRSDGDQDIASSAHRACQSAFIEWADVRGPVNLERRIKSISFQVLSEVMFSPDARPDAAHLIDALDRILQFASLRSQIFRFARKPWKSFDPGRTTPDAGVMEDLDALDNYVYGIIDGCLDETLRPGRATKVLIEGIRDNRIDRVQARDEMATLIFAGFDTIAEMVTWALFLLGSDEEIQDTLRSELAGLSAAGLGVLDHPMPVSPDRGPSDLLQRVLFEALRMYPPAWAFFRRAPDGQPLAGETLGKGAVMISPFTLHRNAIHWPNPDVFDPNRFAACPVSGSYIPFGFGKHTCIGRRTALVEGRVVLSEVLRRFRVTVHEAALPRIRPGIILQAASPLAFTLEDLHPAQT